MPALSCEFADKIRFYDQVIKHARGRLFVPTELEIATGADVELALRLGAAEEPVLTAGKVVAKLTRQGAGAGQVPGVWVQLSEHQVEALRQLLHVESGEGSRITARAQPRLRRSLRVEIDKPVVKSVRTRDISRGGACLDSALPVPVGQTVRMAIEFPDGMVGVFGKVAWSRNNLTGIAFRFQTPEARQLIAERVRRLTGEEQVIPAKSSVLVVDDDAATLRAIERLLAARGYGCITVGGGPEALSTARESVPAMVVLDVLLPGMNGLEVCRVLKRDAHTSRIPVVLTSVLPRDDLAMILRESGALGVLPKPYKLEALAQLVERVVDQRQVLGSGSAAGTGRPVMLRCEYESDSLHAEVYLREASATGGFLVSFWGDAPGTQARLVLHRQLEPTLELEVIVRVRADWGAVDQSPPGEMPGMEVELIASPARDELGRWLAGTSARPDDLPTVLIVDDDRAHLELLTVVMRNSGLAPVPLDTPLGATNAVQAVKPRLVLLDYLLPGAECKAVCAAIRSVNRDVPIWIYSSVSEDHLRKIVSEVGADGWVRKGTRPTAVIEQIKKLLGA